MEEYKFNKDTDIREYRRLIIIRLDEKGMKQFEISDIVGCCQSLVSQVINSYNNQGYSGIASGEHKGAKSRLNKSNKESLKKFLGKGAKHFGFATDGWTRKYVRCLIEQKFGVSYTLQQISNILAELNYTLQKPQRKDPRKEEEAVKEWKEQTLPSLQKEAEEQDKVLFYVDESSFLLNPVPHRTYAPKGQPPIIDIWDKSFQNISVCSGISVEGDFIYTMIEDNYTGEKIVEFLKELLQKNSKSIIVIWDGASVHDCKAVQAFLKTLETGRLKLVKQPSYAPELNADEQVWNYVKNVDLKNRVFKNVNELKSTVKQVFDDFTNRVELIKQFFKNSQVSFY